MPESNLLTFLKTQAYTKAMNKTGWLTNKIRQVNAQQVDNLVEIIYNFQKAAGYNYITNVTCEQLLNTSSQYHCAVGLSRYLSTPPLTSMRFTIMSNVHILDINT